MMSVCVHGGSLGEVGGGGEVKKAKVKLCKARPKLFPQFWLCLLLKTSFLLLIPPPLPPVPLFTEHTHTPKDTAQYAEIDLKV